MAQGGALFDPRRGANDQVATDAYEDEQLFFTVPRSIDDLYSPDTSSLSWLQHQERMLLEELYP